MLRKAFTILELLIVISVIAILVGIALPRFKGMQDEGNGAKARGELRTIQTAVESYRIHNNAYPAAGALGNVTGATPQIIAALPNDPFNGANTYGYFVSTNGNYYVIFSVGPNSTAAITGISDAGAIAPAATGDDIFVSNGPTQSGG